MTARSARAVPWPAFARSPGQRQLARAVVWCAAGWMVALAGVLLWRRLAGAFQQPLPAGGLIAAGFAVAGLAAATRAVWHWLEEDDQAAAPPRIDAFGWLPMLAVGLIGSAVSLPDSTTWALVSFWVTVCGGELAYWYPRAHLGFRVATQNRFSPSSDVTPARPVEPAVQALSVPTGEHVAASRGEEEEDGEPETLPPDICQRIIRAKVADGSAVVYGLVRCEFAADQRQQNVHVVFCPPLAQKPHLHADQILGPKVILKPSLVETFGACLEVRLVAPSNEPAAVQIQFYAAEQSSHERSA